jgi:putative two-component system response regulator
LLVRRGEIDAGLASLERAIAIDDAPVSRSDARLDCVDGYEMAGRPDAALAHLRELQALRAGQQLAQLQHQVGLMDGGHRLDPDAEGIDHKRSALEAQVAAREAALVEAAATAALASGYDVRRPFRVVKLAELFGRAEGMAGAALETLRLAALLQDVGMVAVPRRIIDKRGPLSRAERALLEEHTRHSAQLVASAGLERPRAASDLIRLHHEKWDGSGPCGLKEQEIPPGARVLALCDAFDAMTHDRPFRAARTVSEALMVIEANTDGHFDPQLAQRFCTFVRTEYWRHPDFMTFLGAEADGSAFVRAREEIARYLK